MRKSNALPGLDLLVGFEAAARHLSFTKAGAELYRTQSAVSRQIKELEDQLGVALFQRRHRALALTEPGHQLYAAAAQVLATMRSATERLFGERVFPVCSPKLLRDPKRPLKQPADLKEHCLLQYDDPDGRHPWLHWKTWLEVAGLTDFRPAATLSFSGYEQIIPAAIAGHGVALGRSPLVKDLLLSRELVAPFKSSADPARAYFAIAAQDAAGRPEVAAFIEWLKAEAAKQ